MKVKSTFKPENLSEDNSEVEEDIDDSLVDEESVEDDGEEESDGSVGETDSDENAEDLGASATESDEDVSDDEDDASCTEEPPISKSEMIKRDVLQKYQESHGKRLYIRFPRSISDDEVEQKAKELSPMIINVHKPRQKYARFCLVDFETKDNRDMVLKMLKKQIKKGELEKLQIDIPRTESADYVEQLAERKIKSLENKKVKAQLKRASKKAGKLNSFTSSVLVFNLPKAATVIQVRELFPAAVDVQIKTVKGGVNKDKSIAAITLPSTMEARAAVKKQHLSLGGNQLTVKFDNQKIKKKSRTKPEHLQKTQKGSLTNVSPDNVQAVPSDKPERNATEKKEVTTPKVITAQNNKPANKKRKMPPTEHVPVNKNTKSGDTLPKNKGINKKRKL